MFKKNRASDEWNQLKIKSKCKMDVCMFFFYVEKPPPIKCVSNEEKNKYFSHAFKFFGYNKRALESDSTMNE